MGVLIERLRARKVHLIVVDPRATGLQDHEPATIRWFEDLLTLAGSTPVVVWGSEQWLRNRRVLQLGRIGVREVMSQGGEDHPEIVAPMIGNLLMSRRFDALIRAFPPSVPAHVASYLGALTMLQDEWTPPTSDLMGEALGRHRSTVFRHFTAAGLPPPAQMVGWIRVYLVACLVEEGNRLEQSAMRIGFSSVWNFRRMARNRTGVDLTDEASVVALGSKGVLELLTAALRVEVA